jgi:HSP20 family protein
MKQLRLNSGSRVAGLIVVNRHVLDRAMAGAWVPNVDLCETQHNIVIRVELPGVPASDVELSIHDGVVRVAGVKREPRTSKELVCYYCVERTCGRFEREIRINCIVDASRARAELRRGVLTLNLPRISERRGTALSIPIMTGNRVARFPAATGGHGTNRRTEQESRSASRDRILHPD